MAQALFNVLRALRGGDAPTAISYGSNSDALWAVLGKPDHEDSVSVPPRLWGEFPKGLILAWDGPAAPLTVAGRNTGEYLNPLTWALCAVRKFPQIQVAVLDCDAAKHAKGRFYGVVQAIDSTKRPFRLLANPCCCVADCLAFLREPQGSSRTVTDLLTHQVKAMLTERGAESDHHALANIVGPLILMGNKTVEGISEDQSATTTASLEGRPPCRPSAATQEPNADARTRFALYTLFREVGLLEGIKAAAGRTPPHIFEDRPVRLLLVDDQHEHGWREWVVGMVAHEPACRVEATAKPDDLVKAVKEGLSLGADCRFQLKFPSSPASESPPETETILLLDLRLFSLAQEPGKTPEEVEAAFVLQNILPLCACFLEEDVAREGALAWPGFSTVEIQQASAWCAKPKRDTEEHLIVLSLLPRLLALTDFSLPIVLFSSTGQRKIIELLKPYGNIITDFEKPRFTGLETADLVARTEASFASAIEKASRLLDARRHCRNILDSPGALSHVALLPAWNKTRYVELFLDEGDWTHHGATHFSVGGCFAVFDGPSLGEARARADRFDDALVHRGIRYFESRGVGVEPPEETLLRKGTNIAQKLDDWQTEEVAPLGLGALRMRIEKGRSGTRSGSLANTAMADNRYFLALKSLLELFFCETVQALAGDGDPGEVVVSVFPATRAVSVDLDHQNTAMTNYGLKETGRRGLFYSLDRSFVYPLVDDILDSHAIKRRTSRLLAPQLPYSCEYVDLPQFFVCSGCNKTVEAKGSVSKEELHRDLRCTCKEPSFRPDYRALHYLADEMLSQFPDGQRRRPYDDVFRDLIPGEFDELWDKELADTLAVGRLLDAGDLVGAVAKFRQPKNARAKPRAGVWLGQRLAKSVPTMTGEQFVRLAACMPPIKAAS